MLIGPFDTNTSMNYIDSYCRINKSINFEAGFEYDIQERVERLYQLPIDFKKKAFILANIKTNLPHFPNQWVFTPNESISRKRKAPASFLERFKMFTTYYDFRQQKQKNSPEGEYYFIQKHRKQPPKLLYLFWLKQGELYLVNHFEWGYYRFPSIEEGDYTLVFYRSDSTFAKHSVRMARAPLLAL